MASTVCSICETRAAISECADCKVTLCEECRVKCQICGKVVCREHSDTTTGGRSLCDHCMTRRALAKVERRKQKKLEREKKEGISFEALSSEEDSSRPASATFEESPDDGQGEAEAPAHAGSGGYVSENQTVRLPIDENRPILTGGGPKSTPRWVYIVGGLFVLAVAYFILSRLFGLAVYF